MWPRLNVAAQPPSAARFDSRHSREGREGEEGGGGWEPLCLQLREDGKNKYMKITLGHLAHSVFPHCKFSTPKNTLGSKDTAVVSFRHRRHQTPTTGICSHLGFPYCREMS